MTVEEFLENKLYELGIDHVDEMGYGDMLRILNEYSNMRALELKEYILKQSKKN